MLQAKAAIAEATVQAQKQLSEEKEKFAARIKSLAEKNKTQVRMPT